MQNQLNQIQSFLKKHKKKKNPKKIQTLGQIMKFQNLKLEKERQRNLRSKNEKAFRRKREYLRHSRLRTALRMSSDCLRDNLRDNGYEFALWMNQWVSESEWVWKGGEKGCEWVSVFEHLDFEMGRWKSCVCGIFQHISSLINSISTWLHLAILSR